MANKTSGKVEEYGFPSEFVNPETKDKPAYGLSFARAMYGRYYRQGGYYSQSNNQYVENRKYAEGLQSVEKYKDLLDMNGDSAFANLDFSIVPVAPKFVDLLVGEMTNQEYEIQFNSIDPTSLTEKDKERNKLQANMELAEFSAIIEEMAGVPVIPSGEYIPETQEELDLHMQMNFKQDTEVAMEESVEFVLNNNDWSELRRKIYRDLIVLKRASIRLYYDDNDNIRLRYVDPVNLIVPYTDKDDFGNIRYAGEIQKLEIHQIRRMSQGSLSEEDLYNIAKNSAGKHGNRTWNYGSSFQRYYRNFGNAGLAGVAEYDDFTIPVLDFEFHTINILKFEERENKFGRSYIEEKPYNYVAPKRPKDKRSLTEKELDVVYQGYWVIGTEHMYGYKQKEFMTRDNKAGAYSPDTNLSFIIHSPNIYDMENKSIVERMMPHADAIQLVALKTQLLVAKLTPPGVAVDVSALKDVFLGQGQDGAGPLEILEVYLQTGTFFYNGETDDGVPMNRQPISEIKNSMGTVLQELQSLYAFHIQQIRDVTGINELRSASSVDKDAPVRTQELSLKASRNSTRPIQNSFINIFERSAYTTSLMIQDMAEENRGIEGFTNAIGTESIKVLKEGSKIATTEFGMKIEAKPDDEDMAQLEQDISISIQNGELRIEDGIMIRTIENTKLANQFLILRRKQYAKERQEEAEANAQANAAQQQASTQAAAQAEAMKIQAQHAAKMEELALAADLKLKHEREEHEMKMKQITLENEWKSRHIEQATDEEFKKTALNSTIPQEKVFSKAGGKPSVTP
jgi:hypothetical protein